MGEAAKYPGQRPPEWRPGADVRAALAGLPAEQRLLIEGQVASAAPRIGVTYFLWAFLGLFSAHRFYLGRPGTAILQIASYFVLVGFLWLAIDAFLIPGMVRAAGAKIRQNMLAALA